MKCRTCLLDLPGEAFYSSNRRKCKECIKASVRTNRLQKIEQYREYDRARASRPDRVAARAAYAETDAYRISHAASAKKWDVANAIRKRASSAVSNALRSGELQRQPCFVCGSADSQAHHADYSAPLAVSWLCAEHHAQTHADHREYLRGAGKSLPAAA